MKNSFYLNTGIIGLIGHPIKQSYSPFIHNVAIELKKLDYIYLPFDVPSANLKNALKGMLALGYKGFNVTIPHKVNLIPLVHNVSEEASIIGAVNTVVNDMGKLTGYNTDVNGIMETLLPYKDQIANREVTLIGAGGAARTIIYVLIRHFKPEKINLINRTEERAEGLRVYFKDKMRYENFETFELFPPIVQKILERSKLIINATPVGMFPDIDDAVTLLDSSFHKDQIVFDLVYNPPKTKLLQMAEAKGVVCLDGLKMLVYQAAKSFKLWTGEDMPIEEVHKSLQLMILD
ncbi:MAG TPA: shikimate dehydrogenase [Ignavibacteriaceae bacterium]|nr:shikimate dehydrogenase [Ignavibacteriaceae bacterium]